MTFSKASRLPVLAVCLLLMGFAGASYGAVRFDVVPSPTEVINSGLSEVTGSINLIVRGPGGCPNGNCTGTSAGGNNQIGVIYNSQGTFMPIDNTTTTGIKIFWSPGFNTAPPTIVSVVNTQIAGKCSGFITINLVYGLFPSDNDFIRVEGVRGRIGASAGVTQGTDLYASLQSINDPAASQFTPDSVRVAKSLPGMFVKVKYDNVLLCFPTLGTPTGVIPNYYIRITEGFARAFVDNDAGNDAPNYMYYRVDSGLNGNLPAPLGAPTQQTQFTVLMDSIPPSVKSVLWFDSNTNSTTGAILNLIETTTDGAGNATALYSYNTPNQTNISDTNVETFTLQPVLKMIPGATQTGVVNVAVTLSPNGGSAACESPGNSANASSDLRPRFILSPQSNPDVSNAPVADPSKPYAQIIRCNCYMLFTYVTAASGFNTGIAVANTSQDSQVFGTVGASQQIGKITFYFYSATGAYRGFFVTGDVPFGQSYIGLLSGMLGTANMPDTTFSGYIIAKAEFQYCHAISYIADNAFAQTAQGYAALIIPDPMIKGPNPYTGALWGAGRFAADAGDVYWAVPAGEGLNN
jgi:hypothetical protein